MDLAGSSKRSSQEVECYWGCISRDTEVMLLTASEDGAYLLRDCISDPRCCTLAVRHGEHICRFRVTKVGAFDIRSATNCLDFDGKPVALKTPVIRPQGMELYTQHDRLALIEYDVPC